MGNVLKFPNSLWQANYTIQQRGGRLPCASSALQKHQQAIFQSIEFALAGHRDIERNNWIFQTMFLWRFGRRTKRQVLRGSSGHRSAHYWQISLAYQGLVFPRVPRVVNPTTKYTSLERVVNKWLSAANPSKHSALITVLWVSVSITASHNAVS